MDIQALRDTREQKDEFFQHHPHSPLTDEQKATFEGLRYYDPNPSLALMVEVAPFEEQKQMLMQTNRDELKPFVRYGAFTFRVGGAEASLTVYKSMEGAFFLPFVDANAGTETYSAGRYLDLETENGRAFVVNFNLAYNPYCAYNDRWVCPLTPAENRLDVAIEAGEMLPPDALTDAEA